MLVFAELGNGTAILKLFLQIKKPLGAINTEGQINPINKKAGPAETSPLKTVKVFVHQ